MSSFTANSQTYNVVTESELAEVLSHYNSDFVFSIIDQCLKYRFMNVPVTQYPNVVAGWEQNFKAIIAQYGDSSREEVMRVRNETYREIIDTICKEFNMSFTIDDTVDLYSAAYHMYELMVSNFTDNMVTFFANFIYKERSYIYDSLNLAEMKKNKDSSTIYGKKIYKDIKLAVINANIDAVVAGVCSMDIPYHLIISTIFGNNSDKKKFIMTITAGGADFFQTAYVRVLNSDIRADIITAIRFKLQEIAMIHDQATTDIEGVPQHVATPEEATE